MKQRFEYETALYNRGIDFVIGVDEVGRGPLAGPVVAAAVVFAGRGQAEWWDRIADSKKLTALKRTELSQQIKSVARYAVGISTVEEIEQLNILQASLLAMKRAVESLSLDLTNAHVVVDGKFLVPELYAKEQSAVIKGDGQIHTIAAASIVAKVERDRMMTEYGFEFPAYGFDAHKGYGTAAHIRAIKEFGLSPVHRQGFCGNIL